MNKISPFKKTVSFIDFLTGHKVQTAHSQKRSTNCITRGTGFGETLYLDFLVGLGPRQSDTSPFANLHHSSLPGYANVNLCLKLVKRNWSNFTPTVNENITSKSFSGTLSEESTIFGTFLTDEINKKCNGVAT